MWPVDRVSANEYLRIGRHSIERWVGSSGALSLAGSHTLIAVPELDAPNLVAILQTLYPVKPQAAITILLESAWLPVLLAEVGTALWTPAQVEPLLRHRLNLLYGSQRASTADWDLRIDYRAGDRFALGYGMPLGLKQAFIGAGGSLGVRWASLLPSFAWGLQRLRPFRHWAGRPGWWAWPEQDRMFLARIASNRVVVLNPGAGGTEDAAQITRMVETEMVRSGTLVCAEPIAAATWAQARYHGTRVGRLSWSAIGVRPHAQSTARTISSTSKVYP